MITDQITIMETIPTQAFGNVRLEIKGTLEPGETELDAWRIAKAKIDAAYKALYNPITVNPEYAHHLNGSGNPPYMGEPSTSVVQVDKTPVSMEDQIRSCTELKVLGSYRLIVKTMPHLKNIYDEKLVELSR